MRVLWICNIMLPMIAEQLHGEPSNKEGWLSGLASVVLDRKRENGIELAAAFPMPEDLTGSADRADLAASSERGGALVCRGKYIDGERTLDWYGFREDVGNAHVYAEDLEPQMRWIFEDFRPDVVHCFGTEYGHTLAACRVFPKKNRILVGIQGLCGECAAAYFANLPEKVICSATLRDRLKKDDLIRQQEKFVRRGETEQEALGLAGNVTGRTAWDRHYAKEWNPGASYFEMNETLRPNFYRGEWRPDQCEPHAIFLSQGDYPIKGLHYMLLALPEICSAYPDTQVYVAGNSIVKHKTLKDKLKISAYGRYLRKLMKENGLEERLHFLGKLNAEEMKDRYLRSGLFVCCSSVENSPNSLGEAMLLGVPCVSAEVGGVGSIFAGGRDGILYEGFSREDPERSGPEGAARNAANLAKAVIRMWSDPEKREFYRKNAREHAMRTHDPETNYRRLVEIYEEICRGAAEGGGSDQKRNPDAAGVREKEMLQEKSLERRMSQEEKPRETGGMDAGENIINVPRFVFLSNYINHHQIPFCQEMTERLEGSFAFIQTEPMEEERKKMGWDGNRALPFVVKYYDEPEKCQKWIDTCEVLIFGGVDDERYVQGRLRAGKPMFRYSERLYRTGQWKAISPRGLRKKYLDHTRYRKSPVYLLCAGAYVADDFHIVRAYPGKMFCWGYFPEMKRYDVDKLLAEKGYPVDNARDADPQRPGKTLSLLWSGRMIALKHPELALETARYLKEKGIGFHLDMVGGGILEEGMKTLCREYGLEDRVSFTGFLSPDQVREKMEKADIYLFTSDRREGWGAVANESMNSACALVMDHMIGSAPYLIRQGENGFLYRDGDRKALFQTVERLARDGELRRKLGRNAYETIRDQWNAGRAVEELLKLAERLFSGKEARNGRGTAEKWKAAGPGSDAAEKGKGAGKGSETAGKQNISAARVEDKAPGFSPCQPAPVIPERKMFRYLTEKN